MTSQLRLLGAMKELSRERRVAMTRSDDHIHNFPTFSIDGMLIAVATLASVRGSSQAPEKSGAVAA